MNYKKSNPIAKEVRTPKYKSQVVSKRVKVVLKDKKVIDYEV